MFETSIIFRFEHVSSVFVLLKPWAVIAAISQSMRNMRIDARRRLFAATVPRVSAQARKKVAAVEHDYDFAAIHEVSAIGSALVVPRAASCQ